MHFAFFVHDNRFNFLISQFVVDYSRLTPVALKAKKPYTMSSDFIRYRNFTVCTWSQYDQTISDTVWYDSAKVYDDVDKSNQLTVSSKKRGIGLLEPPKELNMTVISFWTFHRPINITWYKFGRNIVF